MNHVCQESPSSPRENKSLTLLRIKLQDGNEEYIQGIVLSGCNGHDYFVVMLYANPPKTILSSIPKRFRGLRVEVKVWPEHPKID
jgi:hypothetical protein